MSLTQKPIEELKFSDLRVHYGTGRSIHVSGTGRDKKFRYRYGAMTDLGDFRMEVFAECVDRASWGAGNSAAAPAME